MKVPKSFWKRDSKKPLVINGRTLEEVVDLYLRELENPAVDSTMREIYRDWMREFVPHYTAGTR